MKAASELFQNLKVEHEKRLPEHEYEHYVNLTAKMLKKPYFVTHTMVKDWSLLKIKERYYECTKHHDNPAMVWYGKRKRDLGRPLSYE